jgi:phage virion morphogenesis protein
MSGDLQALEQWAGALLAGLQPGERKALTRAVAQDLRRSQQQRIAAQLNVDSSPYDPRKARKNFRGKIGRIKGKKGAMFVKLKTAKYLKIQQDENQIAVGFFGRVARIARVHQYGLTDKIDKNGPNYRYPERQLLGFSADDGNTIGKIFMTHFKGK